MNIFDVLIVQPIFNALLLIYSLVPGHDFGISIIIFTILVRLALWPLIKKQLHQTKLMRRVQPELKKVKAGAKGNKQLEAKLMMELYKERGIKPFSSIGILLVQLPIFIALYQVMIVITQHRDRIESFVYEALRNIPGVHDLATHPKAAESLLGVVDLTKTVFADGRLHVSLLILALLAGLFQYIQTKQLIPTSDSKKKLRDVLKESSQGGKVDQTEITALMSSKMVVFLPLMLFVFALYLPGAVVLYYAVSSLVAIVQQHLILHRDEEEMIELADQDEPTVKAKNSELTVRIKKARPTKTARQGGKKRRRR